MEAAILVHVKQVLLEAARGEQPLLLFDLRAVSDPVLDGMLAQPLLLKGLTVS